MGDVLTAFAIAAGVIGLLVAVIFMRAWTAKMATGKWPHECEESRDIFKGLP